MEKTFHASDTERVEKSGMDYTETITGINLEDLVSVDESGTNISLVRLYIQVESGV